LGGAVNPEVVASSAGAFAAAGGGGAIRIDPGTGEMGAGGSPSAGFERLECKRWKKLSTWLKSCWVLYTGLAAALIVCLRISVP